MKKESTQHAFWALKSEDAINTLESSREGITEKDAQKRLKIFGKNVFVEDGRVSKFQLIFNQFKSPLIFILVIAGAVTLFLQDWVDSAVIFLAVFVNTALGFYQENRAEEALERLKTYIEERMRVIRDGKEKEISASNIVPGDIVHLVSGGRISADARLISVNALGVDEAVLTGESLPVEKETKTIPQATEFADRNNMVHAGTLVVSGSGIAVVTTTGRQTQIGRIAELVAATKRELTPLQKSLGHLAWFIMAALALFVGAIFFLGISRGESIFDMFLLSVAIAVGSIPESLPVALTVILAVGVERLARRKGVVRKLAAAESLGSTTVILTDKTGTLTQAKLELQNVLTTSELVQGLYKKNKNIEAMTKEQIDILKLALLNTDVLVENPKDAQQKQRYIGSPLEVNIFKEARKYGIDLEKIRAHSHFDRVLEFSSQYKFSASFVNKCKEFEWDHLRNKNFITVLGAPEILLERSEIAKDEYLKIQKAIEYLSNNGKRIVGVAAKIVDKKNKTLGPKDVQGLMFAGIIAFHDPIRPEVVDAMRKVKEFGAKTVMVTGDLKGTAISVARQLGWKVAEGNVMSGSDLKKIDDEALLEDLENIKIFARVSPEDKVRIAQLYKKSGETVAMTGDGVNDAPSLKAVDIGIAVGSGTDVAKEVADLVLLDDNFQTIVAAIEEGRRMLSNIKKALVYLVSNSLDVILVIAGSLLVGIPIPLTALQILWVNFFSDSIPALAFAFEENYDHELQRKAQRKNRVLDQEVLFLILATGTLASALLFGLYWYLLSRGLDEQLVRTFIFASFSVYTLFLSWPFRSLKKSIFRFNPFGNKWIVLGIAVGFTLTALAVYVPFFQNILNTRPLPPLWLGGIAIWLVVNVFLVEITKWFFRKT